MLKGILHIQSIGTNVQGIDKRFVGGFDLTYSGPFPMDFSDPELITPEMGAEFESQPGIDDLHRKFEEKKNTLDQGELKAHLEGITPDTPQQVVLEKLCEFDPELEAMLTSLHERFTQFFSPERISRHQQQWIKEFKKVINDNKIKQAYSVTFFEVNLLPVFIDVLFNHLVQNPNLTSINFQCPSPFDQTQMARLQAVMTQNTSYYQNTSYFTRAWDYAKSFVSSTPFPSSMPSQPDTVAIGEKREEKDSPRIN